MDVDMRETAIFELNHLRDRRHHDHAIEVIDRDTRVSTLNERFNEVLDEDRVVKGVFSQVL